VGPNCYSRRPLLVRSFGGEITDSEDVSPGHDRIVELLLGKGANVYGNALQAASRNGHEKVVELLLAGGAYATRQTS
jgi:hypothetical protein